MIFHGLGEPFFFLTLNQDRTYGTDPASLGEVVMAAMISPAAVRMASFLVWAEERMDIALCSFHKHLRSGI